MPALDKYRGDSPTAHGQYAFRLSPPSLSLPSWTSSSSQPHIFDPDTCASEWPLNTQSMQDAASLVTTATIFTTVTLNESLASTPSFRTATKTLTSYVFSATPAATAAVGLAQPTGSISALGTAASAVGSVESHTGGLVHPNAEQVKLIWVAALVFVCLALGWNMVLLRDALYPWKMWINAIHEGWHVFAGILTGAHVYSVTIDPDNGPISGMTNGHPLIILLSGYVGSILVGSALITCAFDISASKIAALTVYPVLLVCFWFGRTWARVRVLICMAVSVGMFFVQHASALRFYVLFLGVMNVAYVLWDVIDDRIFRKANESDVALLARITPIAIQNWILIWLSVTSIFVALAIVAGLHFFDKDLQAQIAAQRTFLWT